MDMQEMLEMAGRVEMAIATAAREYEMARLIESRLLPDGARKLLLKSLARAARTEVGEILRRATLIAGMEQPYEIDTGAQTFKLCSFRDESGMKEVPLPAGVAREFFADWDRMQLNDDDKYEARMNRVRQSPLVQKGLLSDADAFVMDAEGEGRGLPLCSGCKLHHEPHGEDVARDGDTLH